MTVGVFTARPFVLTDCALRLMLKTSENMGSSVMKETSRSGMRHFLLLRERIA
jgi:hypothetical protein